MSEVKLTPEQNEAIHSSGKNILVSASAGSGKTFVMAQRIVEKVKQGIEIDRLFHIYKKSSKRITDAA